MYRNFQTVTSAAVDECSSEMAALQCTHVRYVIAEGNGLAGGSRAACNSSLSQNYVICGYVTSGVFWLYKLFAWAGPVAAVCYRRKYITTDYATVGFC